MALHQPSAALHLLVALLGLADPTVHRMLRLQRVASGNHVLLLLLPRRRRLRLVLDLYGSRDKKQISELFQWPIRLCSAQGARKEMQSVGAENLDGVIGLLQLRRFPVSMRRLYA